METPGEQETVAFRNDVAESDRQKKIAESLGPAEKDRRKSHSNNNKQSGQVASGSTAGAGVGECTLITAYVAGARSEKDSTRVVLVSSHNFYFSPVLLLYYSLFLTLPR